MRTTRERWLGEWPGFVVMLVQIGLGVRSAIKQDFVSAGFCFFSAAYLLLFIIIFIELKYQQDLKRLYRENWHKADDDVRYLIEYIRKMEANATKK